MAAIEELKEALKIKQVNDELLEYLSSSLSWLIHYSNKYQISLPEKEKISLILERILDINKGLPSKSKHPFSTPDDETEPIITSYFA